MASSSLESSDEKIYGFKLMRLIIDGGTEQLRNVFSTKCPGNLQTVLATNYLTLYHLFKTKKIITQSQWDKLYPHLPKILNIKEFDITLLVILLRNICSLSPPATGWNVMPSSTDNSLEADIVRIRLFRNNFFGHVSCTDITRLDFEARWAEVSSVLRRRGLSQTEIDRLKAEECGEDEVNRIRTEWNESEKEVVKELGLLRKEMNESLKEFKSSSKDLSEHLDQHDFKEEIESFYHNYAEGTREWVFDQVSKWLNDKLSDNRAFIISGQAGMGKSTIAAVACKRFREYFGACHFFQYNNSRYNNPKFFLQSLASQLCHVIPKYKQNLANSLSGNKAQSLNNQNIEGMFSMLFTEQFSNIPDPGKYFLIVIDALDECRQDEKHELVDLITEYFHKFPKFIRFLITTRSETGIARKFQRLKPLFLLPDDERNLNDLRLYFKDKLKTELDEVSREKLVKQLVVKSDGLMLYASFLCKLTENDQIVSNDKNLPVGIEKIYDRYFKRLEGELKKLGVDEKQFLTFLSIMTVSKQPLPLALIERLFSTDRDLSSAGRTLQKLLDCVSSLLVFKDESLLFFHKSVRDWLVKPSHQFTITESYGHKALAEICVFEMQTLKQREVRSKFDPSIVYALQYGIQHIVEAKIEDINFLTNLINDVIQLEIVYASVCIDIYLTLSNLSKLKCHNMQNNSACDETQTSIRRLIYILRKFTYILKNNPQSFLQHVVNEGDDVLSSRATVLLMTRYKGLAYFELEDEYKSSGNVLICPTFTENIILEIDISPSEDLLICGYEKGIELFSLPNFRPLWKINAFAFKVVFPFIPFRLGRIVFHPRENVIFPGQLTPVLNFEGKLESGRIICSEIPNKFTTSCFSHDTKKMVTNYGIHLTVWSLFENKKIVSLPCQFDLVSVMFSANDRFIGTTSLLQLCVYDCQNDYSMVSTFCVEGTGFVSTFYSDCWVLNNKYHHLVIAKYDLTFKPVKKQYSNAPQRFPGNARAAAEIQAAVENDNYPWLLRLVDRHAIFFILKDKSLLYYERLGKEIKLVALTGLIHKSNMKKKKSAFIPSVAGLSGHVSLSVDGKYLYAQYNLGGKISIVNLSGPGSIKSINLKGKRRPIVPVTNGVFVGGKIEKSVRGHYFSPGIPELWDFGVKQHLVSFPELIGTCECVSVTQDLVACIMHSQVCFFNVLKKAIVARKSFPELSKFKVIACSSLYHVLIRDWNFAYLLQHANSVDLNLSKLNFDNIRVACFSPDGHLLAICSHSNLYILDTATLNVPAKFSHFCAYNNVEFVDNEHLLCDEDKYGLCLINVETSDIITSINLHFDWPKWDFFTCHNTVGIIACQFQNFKIIKLQLPQQRGNEELECSCLIHGGYINELTSKRLKFFPTHSSCSII